MLALVMNSVPVSFGAVGTPTWFGFGPLNLPESQILEIGSMTALIHSFAAIVIPVMALRFIATGKKEIRQNIVYIYLSIFSCIIHLFLIGTSQLNFWLFGRARNRSVYFCIFGK